MNETIKCLFFVCGLKKSPVIFSNVPVVLGFPSGYCWPALMMGRLLFCQKLNNKCVYIYFDVCQHVHTKRTQLRLAASGCTGIRDYFSRPAKILWHHMFVVAGVYKIEALFDFDKTSVCESDVGKIVLEIRNVRRNIFISC